MTDFPTRQTWLQHRVSYGETDAMGVVYYANYLHFFERSRNEFIRERGMSYRECEVRGVYLPVREAACRYRRPVRYDDLIWIRAGLMEIGRASLTFSYQILNEGKELIFAEGSTQHACVDKNGRPVPTPDWMKEVILSV